MVKLNQVETKNRRLRKKLFLGEFQMLGFTLRAKYKEKVSADDANQSADDFVNRVEKLDLSTFAFHDESGFSAALQHAKYYQSVTENQISALHRWVLNHPLVDVATVRLTGPFDVHYATEEEMGW